MSGIPKQLLNIIGALLVVAVLLAGVLLIAVPMYVQSTRISSDAEQARNSNQLFAAQVEALRVHESEFPALQSDVVALREQIPTFGRFDDVFEIIASAAESTGVEVASATVEPLVPWVPRTGQEALTLPVAAPGGHSPSAPTDAAAAAPVPEGDGEGATRAEGATGGEPGSTGGGNAASPAPATGDPLQFQASFTIEVMVQDPAQATRFIDALGAGPRLVSVVQSTLAADQERFRLTVTALTFVRSED